MKQERQIVETYAIPTPVLVQGHYIMLHATYESSGLYHFDKKVFKDFLPCLYVKSKTNNIGLIFNQGHNLKYFGTGLLDDAVCQIG